MKKFLLTTLTLFIFSLYGKSQWCTPAGDQVSYGTANTWIGYVYSNENFTAYKGYVNEGTPSNPDFDTNFGGSFVILSTNGCPLLTSSFSVRYKLNKTFAAGTYMFTVGGDDGYRLSVDGGATWIIDNWTTHSYTTTSFSISLSGSHNLVLEYFEDGGDNRVSFHVELLSILPITLESFTARDKGQTVQINWAVSSGSDPRQFVVERSINGTAFSAIGTVAASANGLTRYSHSDLSPFNGTAYYRLKMTDMGGVTTYSETVIVRRTTATSAANKISVYPTVVTGNSFLVTSNNNIRNAVITITGLNGKTMYRQNEGNINAGDAIRINANTGNWGKGIYLVSLAGSNFEFATGKIIVQ